MNQTLSDSLCVTACATCRLWQICRHKTMAESNLETLDGDAHTASALPADTSVNLYLLLIFYLGLLQPVGRLRRLARRVPGPLALGD